MKKIVTLFSMIVLSSITFGAQDEIATGIPQDSTMVYDFPERMAQFPGGADALDMFIRKNLIYPKHLQDAGVTGKVYVQFIVEKDGSINNVLVRRGFNKELDKEAVKVVEMMPDWLPGSVRGKTVRVKQTLPIVFSPQ